MKYGSFQFFSALFKYLVLTVKKQERQNCPSHPTWGPLYYNEHVPGGQLLSNFSFCVWLYTYLN